MAKDRHRIYGRMDLVMLRGLDAWRHTRSHANKGVILAPQSLLTLPAYYPPVLACLEAARIDRRQVLTRWQFRHRLGYDFRIKIARWRERLVVEC